METYISISMYPEHAYVHIYIVSENGYEFSTCNMVTIEEARRLSFEFNVEIT